jgi:hypothetical protein
MSKINLHYKTQLGGDDTAKPQMPKKKSKFIVSITTKFKNIGSKIKTISQNRKLYKVSGIIILFALTFLGGMVLETYLTLKRSSNNPITAESIFNNIFNKPSSTNTTIQGGKDVAGTTAITNPNKTEVFNGNITSVNSTQVEVKDRKNVTQKFDFTQTSILLSKDGKTITTGDLKVENKVIIYYTVGDNNSMPIVRLKVLAAN